MIHVITEHCWTPRWIDIQRDFLLSNISVPFRMYSCLEGLDKAYSQSFTSVIQVEGPHSAKLNRVAEKICCNAPDEDILIFLDGDAFPIADLMSAVLKRLAEYPLVAIRRDENLGERHPHPSFCATRIGFWKQIAGDWDPGPLWFHPQVGAMTDTGTNLMVNLERRKIEWAPLLRTNTANLHPVLFGVYGDVIYHHGAGFRKPWSRLDSGSTPPSGPSKDGTIILANKGEPSTQRRLRLRENSRLSASVYSSIKNDNHFYRRFLDGRSLPVDPS